MAEYIEREAVVERINNSIRSWSRDYNSNAPQMVSAYKDVLFRIQSVPTADVAEVVRCKDCAHSYYEYHGEYLFCKHEKNKSFGSGIIVCPNHFCGYGERKDTDGTK